MAGRGALCALLLAFVVSCGAQRNVIRISLCEQLVESASLSSSDVIEVNGDNSRCSEQTSGFVVSAIESRRRTRPIIRVVVSFEKYLRGLASG